MSTSSLPELPLIMVDNAVKAALLEDVGRAGDITSQATIPASAVATGVIAARKEGVLAGVDLALSAFRQIDPNLDVNILSCDGDKLEPGTIVARIHGSARSLLTAERVALNFLSHLSGIASATNAFQRKISHTNAKVVCTRKTTPGLRSFEKYAVRCGGGMNHRFGLDDAILIKDNHIAVAGGVIPAIESARAFAGHLVRIEVEVDTLQQLKDALTARPDVVMLDNMGPSLLRQAVEINNSQAVLEASGTVTLSTVQAIAESGVDIISSGWITHSAPILDLGLDIEIG
ncbi:putative nicotinate-nucleotide pyrophosphorylase [carboxylating] [Pseudovibrio axinellae]|uniref:Probable nicotinate-nucleotide pyrophosphorylase [carboxylating] n=1 Tax=Pseudovibrio axinellae TaxID=989403 RepID=A0A165YGD7_9HYPH|nr:carboxylating nicotinate-nucleotide diphosphorylase [Pseudovibrio axinellae]KZL18820.1 putative nicotinate-nucleotide pyrophosphorylase [carboxylating] [Pseudovibrio axinellae]SEP91638.1 nicotinate-nucleotide pyrophosphorylase [carboxylating] [Pseudovibrio axinellae]